MDAGLSVTAREKPALLEVLYYGVFCIAVCSLGRVIRGCGPRLLARSMPRQPFHNAESTTVQSKHGEKVIIFSGSRRLHIQLARWALTAPLSTSFGLWYGVDQPSL